MVLIIIASFLDDLGLSDIVLIVVDLTILGLLLKDRPGICIRMLPVKKTDHSAASTAKTMQPVCRIYY